MIRRMLAALRRWLGTKRGNFAALLWIAANLRHTGRCLQVMFELRFHGGSLVCIPPQDPLIRTLIQPDGDFVIMVHPRTFAEGRTPEALLALAAQHADALRARLPALDPAFGSNVAASMRALRDAAFALWLGLEALGVAASPAVLHPFAGGWPAVGTAALQAAWPVLRPFLLWQVVAIGVPALLHYATPRVIRAALRRGWLH